MKIQDSRPGFKNSATGLKQDDFDKCKDSEFDYRTSKYHRIGLLNKNERLQKLQTECHHVSGKQNSNSQNSFNPDAGQPTGRMFLKPPISWLKVHDINPPEEALPPNHLIFVYSMKNIVI